MKTINNVKWYRPREIAQQGLIKNTVDSDSEASNYKYILQLIQDGKLKARNYGRGSAPYYLISETSIKKYLDSFKD